MRYLHYLAWASLLSAQTLSLEPVSKRFKELGVPFAFSPLSKKPSQRSHLRIAGVWLPDSIWYDTLNTTVNPPSWIPLLLTTHTYTPEGRILADTTFYNRGVLIPVAHNHYRYYTTGPYAGNDSVSIRSEYVQNIGIQPKDRRRYFYGSLPGSGRKDTLFLDTFTTQWQEKNLSIVWNSLRGGQLRADSQYAYSRRGANWELSLRVYVLYDAQNREDSVSVIADLAALGIDAPGTFYQATKLSYDAEGRLIRRRDTAYALLNNQSPVPVAVAHLYRFYPDPTTVRPSYDSIYQNVFLLQEEASEVRKYTYDANGNLAVLVYEVCTPGQNDCEPYDRERYTYREFPAASIYYGLRDRAAVPNPLRVGESTFVKGERYALYTVDGRLVEQGSLSDRGGWLTAPTQSGLYLLRIDNQVYRLLVLP